MICPSSRGTQISTEYWSCYLSRRQSAVEWPLFPQLVHFSLLGLECVTVLPRVGSMAHMQFSRSRMVS